MRWLRIAFGVAIVGAVTWAVLEYTEPHRALLVQGLESCERSRALAARLAGRSDITWKTTDLSGEPRSLADYRGRVVLLDFWYRNCGWCLQSMPQIEQLAAEFAEEFKDADFIVLGINSDEDSREAQAMVEQMRISYSTLRSEHEGRHIHEQYEVEMWPTFILLDARGTVRHAQVGYWPFLRHGLSAKIRRLLATKS